MNLRVKFHPEYPIEALLFNKLKNINVIEDFDMDWFGQEIVYVDFAFYMLIYPRRKGKHLRLACYYSPCQFWGAMISETFDLPLSSCMGNYPPIDLEDLSVGVPSIYNNVENNKIRYSLKKWFFSKFISRGDYYHYYPISQPKYKFRYLSQNHDEMALSTLLSENQSLDKTIIDTINKELGISLSTQNPIPKGKMTKKLIQFLNNYANAKQQRLASVHL